MNLMEQFETYYKNVIQFDKYLGMDLEVYEPGKIAYRLEVKEHHSTAPDQVHGGVISALMDATLGVTALSLAISKGNLCSTVELSINYISTGKPGDILEGTAVIDHSGSTIITTSGQIIEKKSGRLIAKGMATFIQYPVSKKGSVINAVANYEKDKS